MPAGLLGVAIYIVAITAMVVGLMRPFRKMGPVETNRENFRLGDFFSLSVLMVPSMAVVSHQYSIMGDAAMAGVTITVLLLMSITFWSGLCQWLSRRGIYHSGKRFLFSGFCIPGILILAIGSPPLVIISIGENVTSDSSIAWTVLEAGFVVAGLFLAGIAIYWINVWIAATHAESAAGTTGESMDPLSDGNFEMRKWNE